MPVAVILVVAIVTVLGTSKAGTGGDPIGGRPLYVDPSTPAGQQVRTSQAAGQGVEARAVARIADHQFGFWLANSRPSTISEAAALVAAAATRRQLPLLVIYNLPDRDCGGYSSGGAASDAAYLAWITAVTGAIGTRSAIVIVEPDAVADMASGCVAHNMLTARESTLSSAVRILRSNRATSVYLDAGNPGWIADTVKLSAMLRASGVLLASGFSLNVANFQTTRSNIVYGDRLSSELQGKHFVIDTSRNGNGPYEASTGRQGWCNPPGRRLGHLPTTTTGSGKVDAYLWIKEPGESDGTCRGGPTAGTWWPAYALGLVSGAPAG